MCLKYNKKYQDMDSKILSNKIFPSSLFSSSSDALSGWGIIPNTFRSLLQIPAILLRDPLGFASFVMSPFLEQYLKRIWSLSINDAKFVPLQNTVLLRELLGSSRENRYTYLLQLYFWSMLLGMCFCK